MKNNVINRFKIIPFALSLSGCVAPAMEIHGGAGPKPQQVSDLTYAASGAAFDQVLILTKVPWQARVPIDALAGLAVRSIYVKHNAYLGRTVDSGFMFVIGVYPPEFIRFITHAGKWNREHGH